MNSLLLILLGLLALAMAKDYPDCHGVENHYPILDGDTMYKLVDEFKGNQKYIMTNGSKDFRIIILNLTGDAYSQGYATGMLMQEEIPYLQKGIYDYAIALARFHISFLPTFLLDWIEIFIRGTMRQALNLCYILRKPYIPEYFFKEIHGMADALKTDYYDLLRFNMIPEMLKAWCCLITAWGTATPNAVTYLMRNLDWDEHAPVGKFPVITFYHFTDKASVPFANIGFAGLVGSFTGVSGAKMSIGEQLWTSVNGGEMTMVGEPWHFVVRDVMQFSHNMGEAIERLMGAKRTCLIHLMLGSGNDHYGRGVYYSQNVIEFYDDTNYTVRKTFPGVVYFPYHGNQCVPSILTEYTTGGNKINAETLFRIIGPLHQTGDTLSCTFDMDHEIMYFAFADPVTATKAFNRPHFKLSLHKFFYNTPAEIAN